MAKKSDGNGYKELTGQVKSGNIESFYIFHGEERYLLEHSVSALRKALCPGGLGGFNYKRYDGAGFTLEELREAVDTMPVFADRTLVEVYDYDIFKGGEEQKSKLAELLQNLPGYICLVFIYGAVTFKPDKRVKLNAQILKCAQVIEFALQDRKKLVTWIQRHFAASSKQIRPDDAEYLAFITGGLMSSLQSEIEKTAAYTQNEIVTRADIDAVVDPVPDAVAYKLTDAVVSGDGARALAVLEELLRMREAPHKLMYSITMKMRQLFAARMCIESGKPTGYLMELCAIRYEFAARALMDSARKTTLEACRRAVLACCETALALNSSNEPEARLCELITRLALSR